LSNAKGFLVGLFLASCLSFADHSQAFGREPDFPSREELVESYKSIRMLIRSTRDLSSTNSYQALLQISRRTEEFLAIVVGSKLPDALKRELLAEIFVSVVEHELPLDFTRHGKAFEVLLKPRVGRNDKEGYDIFDEVHALLAVYTRAGRPIPLSWNQFYKELHRKLTSCGSFESCVMGMHLLYVSVSKYELDFGNFEAARMAMRNAMRQLSKYHPDFALGPEVLDSYVSIMMKLLEFRIAREKLELKLAHTIAKTIQRDLEKTFYHFSVSKKNVKFFHIAWASEVQIFEFLLEHGRGEEASEKASERLAQLSLISPVVDSVSETEDESWLIRRQLHGFAMGSGSDSRKLDLTSLIKLVVKRDFDEDSRRQALSEVDRIFAEFQHQAAIDDDASFLIVSPVFTALRNLAATRPREFADAAQQIEEFFTSQLPTFAFALFMRADIASSRFSLSRFMAYYDGIAGLQTPARRFFLKLFANGLQGVRQQFDASSLEVFGSFLTPHKESLQDGADFFFRTGDHASGEGLIRILKESELGEFVSAKSSPRLPAQSLVTLTEYERGVLRALESHRSEYLALSRMHRSLTRTADVSQRQQVSSEMVEVERRFKLRLKSFLEESIHPQPNEVASKAPRLRRDVPALIATVQNDRIVATLLEGDRSKQVVINVGKRRLREAAFHLLIATSQRSPDWGAAQLEFDQLVIAPIRQSIGFFRGKDIYLIGDDILSLVPHSFFEFGSGYRLVGTATVSGHPARSADPGGGIDAFANTKGIRGFAPLPAAGEEAKFVGSFPFRGVSKNVKRSVHIDLDFSRVSFAHSLSQERLILHVATHFQLKGTKDRDSGLLLGDGTLLTLDELLASKQRTGRIHLLTLSACRTAIPGKALDTHSSVLDSVAGVLSRLGVSNVIGTLWEVGDLSTADFMKIFYTLLLDRSLSVPSALEQTKLIFKGVSEDQLNDLQKAYPNVFDAAMRSRLVQYRHPFYWSGFILYTRH